MSRPPSERRGDGPTNADPSFRRAIRGVTPAVAKSVEAALVVLFLAGATTTLYAGVIPEYRTAASAELADRTAAAAAQRVEAAVPPPATDARVVHRVALPPAIRGAAYRIVAGDDALRLDHPAPGVSTSVRLALPRRVSVMTGSWESGAHALVVVETTGDGLVVRLTDRAAIADGPAAATGGGRTGGGD